MCAKHGHKDLQPIDFFNMAKPCGPCITDKPFLSGVVRTERYQYDVQNGKHKIVRKFKDSLGEG